MGTSLRKPNKNDKLSITALDNIKLNLNVNNVIIYALLSVMILFLIAAPFYRGLYFRENFIPSLILISAVFFLSLVFLNKGKINVIVDNYVDIGVLALVLSYVISFFTGISKMESLDGVLKYIGAYMVYKVIYIFSKGKTFRPFITYGIIASGFVTSLFSMLGASGVIKINGVFGWGERLNGLYQYPNSTASVLAAVFLFSVILLISEQKKFIRLAYQVSAATVMLAFLETRSRGGLLVLAAAWLITLIMLKGSSKLNFIIYTGSPSVLSVLTYSKVYSTFIDKKGFLGIYAVLVVAAIVSGYILELCRKYIDTVSGKAVNRAILALFLIVALGVAAAFNIIAPLELAGDKLAWGYEIYNIKPDIEYIVDFTSKSTSGGDLSVIINGVNQAKERVPAFGEQFKFDNALEKTIEFRTPQDTMFMTVDFVNNNPASNINVDSFVIKDKKTGDVVERLKLAYKFIPDDIAKKINEISLKTESSSERFVFVRDGIKMFKDYFLTGAGAKGWSLLYTKYQSYGYVSAEAHNYYLQTAIEAGILGLLSLAAILLGIAGTAYKMYRKGNNDLHLLVATFIMIFTLLAHAFIDFDFSIYAILLLLFAAIGLLTGMAHEEKIFAFKLKNNGIANFSAIIAAAVVFIVTSLMYSGMWDSTRGVELLSTDMSKAKGMYEKAIGKGFYNSAYIIDYGQILAQEAEKTGNKTLIQQAYANFKKVEKLDPYKVDYYNILLNFYFKNGYISDALAVVDRLMDIQPFKPSNYEVKAEINHTLMGEYTKAKKYKEALECADSILAIEEEYKAANSRTIAPFELTKRTTAIITVAEDKKERLEKLAK